MFFFPAMICGPTVAALPALWQYMISSDRQLQSGSAGLPMGTSSSGEPVPQQESSWSSFCGKKRSASGLRSKRSDSPVTIDPGHVTE